MSEDIPEWAIERACELANVEMRGQFDRKDHGHLPTVVALAKHVAQYEEPPVDPLLIEARKLAAKNARARSVETGKYLQADEIEAGKYDENFRSGVSLALAGLRRGIEIGRADA